MSQYQLIYSGKVVIVEGETIPSNDCIELIPNEAQQDTTKSKTKCVQNVQGLSEVVTANEIVINGTDFTCKICPKPYKVFHHLQIHYRITHSKNLLLGCLKCKGKFDKNSLFKNHKCKY